jgi:hypothetical protein
MSHKHHLHAYQLIKFNEIKSYNIAKTFHARDLLVSIRLAQILWK